MFGIRFMTKWMKPDEGEKIVERYNKIWLTMKLKILTMDANIEAFSYVQSDMENVKCCDNNPKALESHFN